MILGMEKARKVGVGVSIREDDLELLRRYAETRRTTVSQIFNDLLAPRLPEWRRELRERDSAT